MIYVIAGNHEQAYDYINRKLEERIRNGETVSKIGDYKYVDGVNTLKGIYDPRGVFIGTWRERKDIKDILLILNINSENKNPVLKKMWEEVNGSIVKNKLTKVPGGWINEQLAIDNAANLLAKAIDQEVLENLHKKINGGNNG